MKIKTTSLIASCLSTFLFVIAAPSAHAKLVKYELNVTRQSVNLSGMKTVDFALMVNGSIPAPTLEFTEGDDAEITVNNRLSDEEVSIHWHGILLPPLEDGVAYVNTPPIHAGQSRTFRFKIRQHGTYWYHSHTAVQEQKGVYGAFIIHPKKKTIAYDKDVVVVLSDWSDENADDIIKNLRKDGEYYAFKKGTIRSWTGAIQAGKLGTFLHNEWTRMGGMDLSDVGYDAFLINGKRDSQLLTAHPGEKLRLRIINAAASSYFYVSLGQAPMKVISADGVDIDPVLAKEVLMGMAETIDVLFEIPQHKNYELRATVQDVTGHASGWIGMGEKVAAPDKPYPDLYASMDHGAHADHGAAGDHSGHGAASGDHSAHASASGGDHSTMDHSTMDHSKMDHSTMDHSAHGTADDHSAHAAGGAKTPAKKGRAKAAKPAERQAPLRTVVSLTVDEIKAPVKTAFPAKTPRYDLKLVLGGDMERYVWHINGKAIHQDRTITINEGDVVRFTFQNDTMMHHPMHLHGHFFRVVNRFGDESPLKHTVDVPPHGSRTIEFLANEPGEWMLHCHNLYHMKTGMARVVKYSTFTPSPEIAPHQKHDPHLHDHLYTYGKLEAATNHGEANLRLTRTWDDLDVRAELRNPARGSFDYSQSWELEGDLFYRRWFGQYLNVIAGGQSYDETATATVGIGYLLPMLVETNVLVDHKGKWRVDLEKKFQWTSTLYSDIDFTWRPNLEPDHQSEFELTLMYAPKWEWAAGLMLTNYSLGLGLEYQF
ncbi:MAG TPA: multicopper oxidase domain-containing protein [Bdellovibrionales bacterium]|nr:multicopper oxidase domain-containing protein [Bdellovibrionales bacterium]